jgi:hypothetical protein
VETITDYLSLDALAYIAITGDGFCMGAWKGFMCTIKHSLEYQSALIVTSVFINMCKLMICVINTITGLFVMYDITGSGFTVKEHFIPIAIVFCFSWMIGSLFLSVFMTVSQTLMMCLAVDMDLNDKRPEFGPVSFHEAVHTVKAHNKKSGGYVQKKGNDDDEDLLSSRGSSVASSAPENTPMDNGMNENLF